MTNFLKDFSLANVIVIILYIAFTLPTLYKKIQNQDKKDLVKSIPLYAFISLLFFICCRLFDVAFKALEQNPENGINTIGFFFLLFILPLFCFFAFFIYAFEKLIYLKGDSKNNDTEKGNTILSDVITRVVIFIGLFMLFIIAYFGIYQSFIINIKQLEIKEQREKICNEYIFDNYLSDMSDNAFDRYITYCNNNVDIKMKKCKALRKKQS